MSNTIKLKNYLNIFNEYDAAGVITPGNVLELTSAGKVQRHSNEGENAPKYIAIEDNLQGKGIDENYAVDDKVQVWTPQPGDEGYLLLEDGENVSIGDLLESSGSGTVQKWVADSAGIVAQPLQVIAQALEAVDLSQSANEDADGRIKVRFV